MTLTKQEKEAIINYRVEKSLQTFKEAKENAQLGNWSLAANRLYYSIFYMALAINLNAGDFARTHNGTFNLFSQRYIATGLLSEDEKHLYRNLFSMRQTGDYDDLFDWDENDILPLIPQVDNLLKKMRGFLSQERE